LTQKKYALLIAFTHQPTPVLPMRAWSHPVGSAAPLLLLPQAAAVNERVRHAQTQKNLGRVM
jgi:hypothetical protein